MPESEKGLVNISNQFSGLDMAALIGGPLSAACSAQTMLAKSTLNFIEEVGLGAPDKDGNRKVRTANFSFTRSAENTGEGKFNTETVDMNIPLLAIVNVPALSIDKVNITFDMEVKSSTSSESSNDKSLSGDASAGFKKGPFHMDVTIKGSISCHEKNTRTSDNSAKYHVEVSASQQKTPEGLSRMLDILTSAVAPSNVKKESAGKTPDNNSGESDGNNPA